MTADDSQPPVGPAVAAPEGRRPERTVLAGRHARIEPIDPAVHADSLYDASHGPQGDASGRMWTYMTIGPFVSLAEFRQSLTEQAARDDPLAFAILDATSGRALGMASYMRIVPAWATCEVGAIWFSPALKQTRIATEAMYLMARHVFEDLDYRRYEWKCDSFNAASRSAAVRFGFSYEGLFRKHVIYKGRSRDTAWYAMLEDDWPRLRTAYESWLDDANFDAAGMQRRSLSELTKAGG
jgi:RimJ/RimL family protein N-acetyltransferase